MFGVVLWSDASSGKAVIWCEDHGDLAFYHEDDRSGDLHLGTGDLVEFDLTTEREFRFVRNPQLVRDSYSSGLADALTTSRPGTAQAGPKDTRLGEAAEQGARPKHAPAAAQRLSADIIPFDRIRAARSQSTAVRQQV